MGLLICQETLFAAAWQTQKNNLQLALKPFRSVSGGCLVRIDTDGSGVIDYSEFMAATLDKRQWVAEDGFGWGG